MKGSLSLSKKVGLQVFPWDFALYRVNSPFQEHVCRVKPLLLTRCQRMELQMHQPVGLLQQISGCSVIVAEPGGLFRLRRGQRWRLTRGKTGFVSMQAGTSLNLHRIRRLVGSEQA